MINMIKDYSKDVVNVSALLLDERIDSVDDIEGVFDQYGISLDYEDLDEIHQEMAIKLGIVKEPDWDDMEAVDQFDEQLRAFWDADYTENGCSIQVIKHGSQLMNDLLKWYGSKANMLKHITGGYMLMNGTNNDLYFYSGYGYDFVIVDLFNLPDGIVTMGNLTNYQLIEDVTTGKHLTGWDVDDYQKSIN